MWNITAEERVWQREKTELRRANDDLKVMEFNQELMLSNEVSWDREAENIIRFSGSNRMAKKCFMQDIQSKS